MELNEIIDSLTLNGKYATDICLMLLVDKRISTLNYLYSLNIKGKDLEVLYTKCCFDDSLECLVQTTRYLRSGFLDDKTIFLNLRSKNPIHFIDRLLKENEDWEIVYESYTYNFFKNFNNTKLR